MFLQPIAGGTQTAMLVLSDSLRFGFSADVREDRLALRASTTGKLQHGRVGRDGTSYAEVAIPDKSGNVLLFASSLRDTLANDNLVGSRLLWAGLVALLIAMTVGYGASSVFARRIRRLEHAAERIAGGDFSEPVVDRRRDELGQLAAAFERMRLQLAQLDDARRAFIANASHELRTPIFSLSGFLELLQDEDLDEETQHEFLATMSEQVQRLSKLATDLLDLSRLDAGRMRLELEPVPLADAAQDLSREFAAVALRLEHPLDVVVEQDGVALADRERVIQIGRALIDNALVHTPEGTPVRIVVRGPVLSVEDDGPAGISAGGRGAGVRPLHASSRLEGLRHGPRAGDRARARRADGRRAAAAVGARPDGVRARVAGVGERSRADADSRLIVSTGNRRLL